jgi:hypothetical protein
MDPLFFPQQWALQRTLVDCPSCHATGTFEGKRCLACRQTGKVTPDRVCEHCHQWLQACICSASEVVVDKPQKVRYGHDH